MLELIIVILLTASKCTSLKIIITWSLLKSLINLRLAAVVILTLMPAPVLTLFWDVALLWHQQIWTTSFMYVLISVGWSCPLMWESTCEKVLPSSPPENPEVCIKKTTLKQMFQVKGQSLFQMILFSSQGKAGENELPELDEKSPFSNRDELRLHQLPTRLKVWFGLDNILPAASIKLIRNCFSLVLLIAKP